MSNSVSNINRLVPGLVEQIGGKSTNPSSNDGLDKGTFGELLSDLISSTNELQHDAAEAQQALMAGEPVELHQVMIKAEKAGLTMDLLLEIRNKLVNTYTEIMRMPM